MSKDKLSGGNNTAQQGIECATFCVKNKKEGDSKNISLYLFRYLYLSYRQMEGYLRNQ